MCRSTGGRRRQARTRPRRLESAQQRRALRRAAIPPLGGAAGPSPRDHSLGRGRRRARGTALAAFRAVRAWCGSRLQRAWPRNRTLVRARARRRHRLLPARPRCALRADPPPGLDDGARRGASGGRSRRCTRNHRPRAGAGTATIAVAGRRRGRRPPDPPPSGTPGFAEDLRVAGPQAEHRQRPDVRVHAETSSRNVVPAT